MPYCAKCGAEISEEARFCPTCGAPVGPPERVPYEKPEKREKREKEEKHEHEKPEKGEGDVLGAFVGASILILLGILLLLAQTATWITWTNLGWYFLFGLGCILIVYAVLRAAVTTYRATAAGPLIGGVILCLIGLAGIISIENWWPIILIAVGIAIVVGGLLAVSRSPKPR